MAQIPDVGLDLEALTATLNYHKEDAVNQLFKRSLFLDHAKKSGGIEEVAGSNAILRPLTVAEHSQITQLVGAGYNTIDMSVSEILKPTLYQWCSFVAPVVISRVEELQNRGEFQKVNYVKNRMDKVLDYMRQEVEKQIIAGTSTRITELATLNGGTTATDNGFLFRNDTGLGGSVGGLARSTANGLNNYALDATDLTPTRALNKAWAYANEKSIGGKTSLIIASPIAWELLGDELGSLERFQPKDTLDANRQEIVFMGTPITFSSWMPEQSGHGEFYGIDFSGIKVVFDPDAYFQFEDFIPMETQLAKASRCVTRLQLVADHLASQFSVYNVGAETP